MARSQRRPPCASMPFASLPTFGGQWMGALALFLVLTGGVAYAADTIGSSDVINGSPPSGDDPKNNDILSADLKANQVYSSDVRDDTLVSGGLVLLRPQGRLGASFRGGE